MSTLKTNRTALSFTFYQFFSLTLIGEQGMAQWWELSSPSSTQPDVYAICGLSLLLVLSFAPRGFSPGTPVFPSPRKPTLSNSNSIWNARTRLNEFMWTPRCFVGKQAINNFFFFQKCQVPSPCIAWYLECRFLGFMPLSKNYFIY